MNKELFRQMQKFVTRYYMQFPNFRQLKRYQLVSFHIVYDIAVVAVEDVANGKHWDLFQFVIPDSGDYPFLNYIRTYYSEQRANIAYVALTEL